MTAEQIKFVRIGSKLMDMSEGMNMKGLKDADIALVNKMSSFGEALTRIGTSFGPRNISDVLKLSGVTLEEAQRLVKMATQ